jgi:ABC-type nickel/cobalt efflux system permease component RcnA
MGVSGGLVPCPEALRVMVLAVGVNQTVLGLGLIMSFSIGLAAVLMGLGIILVRSRHLISRFERIGTRWVTVLLLISALVVSALGIGLLIKGIHGLPFLQ